MISTRATACPKCGMPLSSDKNLVDVVLTDNDGSETISGNRTGPAVLSCPTCGSGNVQSLSIAYEGGLSTVNTRSSGSGIGIGIGRGGIIGMFGTGGGKTRGTAQTALSRRCAPPQPAPVGALLVIWSVAIFIYHLHQPAIETDSLWQVWGWGAAVIFIGCVLSNATIWRTAKPLGFFFHLQSVWCYFRTEIRRRVCVGTGSGKSS